MTTPITKIPGRQLRDIDGSRISIGSLRPDSIDSNYITNGLAVNGSGQIMLDLFKVVDTDEKLYSYLNDASVNNIYVKNGSYILSGSVNITRNLRIVGETKDGVSITVMTDNPSGTIMFDSSDSAEITGLCSFDSLSKFHVTISGVPAGAAPIDSWVGADLILDSIPVKVSRIVSGDVAGVATVLLSEAYIKESFSNVPYNLRYLNSNVSIENLSIFAESNILLFNNVKSFNISNCNIVGKDPINLNSQGIVINNSYFGNIENVTIKYTKQSTASDNSEYAINISDSAYISMSKISIVDVASNGVRFFNTKNSTIIDSDIVRITGSAIKIQESKHINVSDNSFVNYGIYNRIIDSDSITVDHNIYKITESPEIQAINIQNSEVYADNNIIENMDVVVNTDKKVIFSSNKFIKTLFNNGTLLAISGSGNGVVESNVFNGLNNIDAVSIGGTFELVLSNNFINNTRNAITTTGTATAKISSNIINMAVNGILTSVGNVYMSIDNNNIVASTKAIEIPGSNNYIYNNAVISGSIYIQPDSNNQFNILTNIKPENPGIDIGSSDKPFNDLFIDGNISGVKDINMNNGYIYGAQGIYLKGFLVTAGEEMIFVNGKEIAGGAGVDGYQYVHLQFSAATTWIVTHNFKTTNVDVTVYDGLDKIVYPQVEIINSNAMRITFGSPTNGKAIVQAAGMSSTVQMTSVQFVHVQETPGLIWNVNHYLGSDDVTVSTWDEEDEVFIPVKIKKINPDTIQIVNAYPKTGKAIIRGAPSEIAYSKNKKYTYTQITPAEDWIITHNLNTSDFIIQCFDDINSGNVFFPLNIKVLDSVSLQITNDGYKSGRAVIISPENETEGNYTSSYRHIQNTASDIWNISHSLSSLDVIADFYYFDNSQIKDVPYVIEKINESIITVQFDSPVSGTATVIAANSKSELTAINNSILAINESIGDLNVKYQRSFMNRNYIYNPEFKINDITPSGIASISNGDYFADVFKFDRIASNGEVDVNINYLSGETFARFQPSSTYTPPGSQYVGFQYNIEGNDLLSLYKDSGEFATLSFKVRTNIPGNYIIRLDGKLTDPTITRVSFLYYQVFTAGVWTDITLPFMFDSKANIVNTYNIDENAAFRINFVLASTADQQFVGSTTYDGINAWQDNISYAYKSHGVGNSLMNFMNSTSNYFDFKDLKLEKGNARTNLERLTDDEYRGNLSRYYQKHTIYHSGSITSTEKQLMISHTKPMRTSPSVTLDNLKVDYSSGLVSTGFNTLTTSSKTQTVISVSSVIPFKAIGSDSDQPPFATVTLDSRL